LFIESVQIKTEKDEDVKDYVQKKDIEWVLVELPEEYKKIISLVNDVYKEKLKHLKSYGMFKPVSLISKKDLLLLQKDFQQRIRERDRIAYSGISLVAQLLKLNHAVELLETQSLNSFKQFMKKLQKETSKASLSIKNNSNIIKAYELANKSDLIHPKLEKLVEIVKKNLVNNPNSRIIVFANYRNMVSEIVNELKKYGIKVQKFVGQADRVDKGLKQKEQIEILEKFKRGNFNVLVSSQVAEEGIDIVETSGVIFFEPIPSELRKVQRAGRTARTKPGKIIFLITKGTRDEAYYWSSYRKEKRMVNLLTHMKKKNLTDFIK